ncbi:hypothetical protein [Xenorhabdus lircayensis]|nr:hypothetical protein [Xenorhabdus lircayensis]
MEFIGDHLFDERVDQTALTQRLADLYHEEDEMYWILGSRHIF